VKELFEKFQKISSTNGKDNVIDKVEFCAALGRKESPFMDRLFELFDTDGSGTIDFREFISGLNKATHGTSEDKIMCKSTRMYLSIFQFLFVFTMLTVMVTFPKTSY
jgi:serine/threonine-protein phosphatase 2B regulatory subunit